jgi:prepilin-type N-terminal cleavage/methylation domain-containing protein
MRGHVGITARRRHPHGQRGITLVELLVAMTIMSVITAMLLMGWFALSRSWAFTTHSADARDSGRQAMQRIQREVRDAEKPPQGYLGTSVSGAPDAIIFRARAYWIAFSTTFNNAGNATADWTGPTPTPSPSRPHLVVYRLYSDRELWRFEDLNGDGQIGINMTSEYPPDFSLNEQQTGEGAMLVVKDVVNYADTAHPVPLFAYNYYDSAGVLVSDEDGVYGADRQAIIAVQLRLLVDLDPTKAPMFADLRGTAQLRNSR